MLSRLAYHTLKLLPAETAHDIGKIVMKRRVMASPHPPQLPCTLLGVQLVNPLGLAAGFDKNGELLEVIGGYGFGFEEVGSVTFRGGPGNPRPRMFRTSDTDIMNRMGLNGQPAEAVAQRLRQVSASAVPYGVNIAKTHDPAITGDAAIDDMLGSYRLLKELGFYTVLNVSCPNTAEGKTFERPESLTELLASVNAERSAVPLLVKLSPFDDDAALEAVVQVCEDAQVEGYVAVNTKPIVHETFGRGGQSGKPVQAAARRQVKLLKERTGKTVIGCGGLFTSADADALLQAGADAVQAYNGFVRGPHAGPRFAWDVVQPLAR